MVLSYPVKESRVTATFDNGVLELRLPKAEEVKAKKIEIKAQLPQGETKKRQRKPREKKSYRNGVMVRKGLRLFSHLSELPSILFLQPNVVFANHTIWKYQFLLRRTIYA